MSDDVQRLNLSQKDPKDLFPMHAAANRKANQTKTEPVQIESHPLNAHCYAQHPSDLFTPPELKQQW